MKPGHDGLGAALAAALGCAAAAGPDALVHGGCVNDCFRWNTAAGPVFLKLAPAGMGWILDAERDGLERLAAAGALRVPAIRAAGTAGAQAFLALEWLDLHGPSRAAQARLGAGLARLHHVTESFFGLPRDNGIGATRQHNAPDSDWPRFWRERRLRPQLELAAQNGHAGRLQERGLRLLDCVGDFFTAHAPQASLLHGDLWHGNCGGLDDRSPVIFDPAVYYGDAEADVAMTRLFDGFSEDFYAAYEAERPPAAGAGTRCELYNLYHVLNHLNLFGGGYRAQAESLIDRLLAAAGR